ncbi:MAG: D-sedoheptulose-7-phosphate isomerase, partial [Acidimicrobiales bacterium]
MGAIGASDGVLEGQVHLAALTQALATVDQELLRLETWGAHLATVLGGGGRLLAAGNGGSAAQAEHLAAELLGRYRTNRRPLSGLALATEGAALTAIDNDFGADQVFTRQVEAHGRPGDVLVALSTSGRSPNVLAAVVTAHAVGMTTWALTGAAPNPLAAACDDVIAVPSTSVATVQEVHQV